MQLRGSGSRASSNFSVLISHSPSFHWSRNFINTDSRRFSVPHRQAFMSVRFSRSSKNIITSIAILVVGWTFA